MYLFLKDIVNIISGGTPKTSVPKYWNGNIPWISIKDFNTDNIYIDTTEKSITKLGLENSSTNLLLENDIIISARGTVGCLGIIKEEMAFNQSCYGLRVKNTNQVNSKYIFWFLKNTMNLLKSKTHGSVFDTIIKSDLENFQVFLPNLKIQNRIAKILDDITKKIIINNKINKNLEEIIKNNYELLIKNCNWKEVSLDTISSITSGKRPVDKLDNGRYPIVGANGVMAYTNNYNYNDDLIITGRVGTLGIIKRYFEKIWASDNTLIIKTHYLNYIENYLKTINYNSLNRGSTQPLLTQGDLNKQIIKFDETKVLNFEKDNQIFIDRIRNNDRENRNLSQLRDTLLPRLMNGEIDLSNVEI